MRNNTLNWAVSAALALSVGGSALAASMPVNPSPTRDSKLLFGFETPDVQGWTSDPGKTGTSLATQSTDPATVDEGKASLAIDLTSQSSGWSDPAVGVTLAQPIDITGYGTFSMDVYVPTDSIAASGGWYQPNLRITDSAGMTTYYGNRDLSTGWNHLTWELLPNVNSISKIFFAVGFNSSKPFTGPIYLDNVRVWKGHLPGVHPDETLIDGWDDPAEKANLNPTGSLSADINTDPKFIQSGKGSLKMDMTTQNGWSYPMLTANIATPVDLSKAIAVRVDVYVPKSSLPMDANTGNNWWQVGFGVKGDGGTVQGPPEALNVDTWDTLELALAPEDAAKLTNTSAMVLGTNSGAAWTGPVYLDNLRAVFPSTAPPVVKGDINADKTVDLKDATLALQMAVGLVKPSAAQLAAGDLDASGSIDLKDVTKILEAAVGLIKL